MSKPAKELDPWCRPDGSWAVGKRMVVPEDLWIEIQKEVSIEIPCSCFFMKVFDFYLKKLPLLHPPKPHPSFPKIMTLKRKAANSGSIRSLKYF